MTRNRKLEAFRIKAFSLATGALLGICCLVTSYMSGVILIAANTTAQAKAGGHGGHSSSSISSSSHGGNAHSSGAGANGAVSNNGASPSGVSHPSVTPAEEGGHGGHAPCSSAECP
jgi:hypothetical protein